MSLGAIRDAIQTRAATVPGVTAYDHVPDLPTLPAVVVELAEPFLNPQVGMGRSTRAVYRFTLTVLASRSTETTARDTLDSFASADGPLIPTLQAGPLPGVGDYLTVVSGDRYGESQIGPNLYLGFQLTVEVGT